MDETSRWVIGTLILIQTGVIAFLANVLWTHIRECRQTREQLGGMAVNIERIRTDIGDHEHGIRGWLHELADRSAQHELRIELLDHMSDRVKK